MTYHVVNDSSPTRLSTSQQGSRAFGANILKIEQNRVQGSVRATDKLALGLEISLGDGEVLVLVVSMC